MSITRNHEESLRGIFTNHEVGGTHGAHKYLVISKMRLIFASQTVWKPRSGVEGGKQDIIKAFISADSWCFEILAKFHLEVKD